MGKIVITAASKGEINKAASALNQFTFSYTGSRKLTFNKRKLEVALIAKEDDKVIGFCYADKQSNDSRTRKTAYFGCFIRPGQQSKGIGTQLTERLIKILKKKGFVRLEADIAAENTASRKLVEKLGFKREGILKKRFLTDDGRLIDDYWYGKLI